MARRLNLIPPSERSRTTTDFGLLILIGVAIVVIFAIGFGYYLLNGTLTDREQELADLQQQNASLQAQLAELRQYGDIQRDRVDTEEVVQGIYASRTLVSDILDGISLVVPENAWFQSVALTTLDPLPPGLRDRKGPIHCDRRQPGDHRRQYLQFPGDRPGACPAPVGTIPFGSRSRVGRLASREHRS